MKSFDIQISRKNRVTDTRRNTRQQNMTDTSPALTCYFSEMACTKDGAIRQKEECMAYNDDLTFNTITRNF